MIDLKALRELCDAATQGKWECGTHPANPKLNIIKPIMMWGKVTVLPQYEGSHASMKNKADAEFIAATDPPTVRALIDEIERLQRDLEIADYAFDLCHRYNGNNKRDYFNQAEQALKGTDDE